MNNKDKIKEEYVEKLKGEKSVSDLSEKHFSRYGEFLVSFELSKYGWNVYNPVYDEYIDLIVNKYVCKDCGRIWNQTTILRCEKCGKDFSKTEKSKIKARKICIECNNIMYGNRQKCNKCYSRNLLNSPECYICGGEVKLLDYVCECGCNEYISKFRTIQVKSSRIEYDKETGRCKNTYAVDIKPKDLIKDGNHFFVWCLIDDNDIPHFLVMSVDEFINTMGNSINGISFLKDQGREHFSSIDYGKWKDFEDKFDKLD